LWDEKEVWYQRTERSIAIQLQMKNTLLFMASFPKYSVSLPRTALCWITKHGLTHQLLESLESWT